MKVLVVGGGIGGLATALSLYHAGIDAEVFEQAHDIRELGVGINVQPYAISVLAGFGLLPALDRAGIRTRELIYCNRFGQTVWKELRGTDAGYDVPQFSIHRGKLLGVLHQAAVERLGPARLHTACRLVGFAHRDDRVVAFFERRSGERFEVAGDAVIGADGIHSTVRSILYPHEGAPIWNGTMLWRGALAWPVYQDGRTMVIAGGNGAKFVFYPIHTDGAQPQQRLTNWAVMARLGDGHVPPPRRENWKRIGKREEALGFVRDRFHLGFLDPAALIEATDTFYEYPNCDRDPLPGWSFGRVTLLGDAAHPMYPVGGNGASQAILDAQCLARCLTTLPSVAEATPWVSHSLRLRSVSCVTTRRSTSTDAGCRRGAVLRRKETSMSRYPSGRSTSDVPGGCYPQSCRHPPFEASYFYPAGWQRLTIGRPALPLAERFQL